MLFCEGVDCSYLNDIKMRNFPNQIFFRHTDQIPGNISNKTYSQKSRATHHLMEFLNSFPGSPLTFQSFVIIMIAIIIFRLCNSQ